MTTTTATTVMVSTNLHFRDSLENFVDDIRIFGDQAGISFIKDDASASVTFRSRDQIRRAWLDRDEVGENTVFYFGDLKIFTSGRWTDKMRDALIGLLV